MRNTFNLLLISMIAFDSWYLLGSILENFRRNFGLGSQLHTILFPKFLYPAMSVAMSGSIFMTVAISLERYFAVHHPIGNKINTTLSSVFQFYVKIQVSHIIFNFSMFYLILIKCYTYLHI